MISIFTKETMVFMENGGNQVSVPISGTNIFIKNLKCVIKWCDDILVQWSKLMVRKIMDEPAKLEFQLQIQLLSEKKYKIENEMNT